MPLSQVGRAAHDIGLASLLGGNLFGRLALHPSVTEINDKAERGRLVNAAWRRYGTVNSLSLLAVLAGWLGARAREAAPAQHPQAERRLAVAKDALVGVVAATGVATAIEGVRFSRQAPGGAIPLEDGEHTAAEASEARRRAKRRLNALGLATLRQRSASSASTPPSRSRAFVGRHAGARFRGGVRNPEVLGTAGPGGGEVRGRDVA